MNHALLPMADGGSSLKESRPRPALRKTGIAILPSFVSYAIFRDEVDSPAGKWYETSYLDGLRGIASWIVFNFHLGMFLNVNTRPGWGHDDDHRDFWLLPVVRVVHSGDLAVAVFFIVSGMALSLSAVKLMAHSHQQGQKFLTGISSSVFRRPFRLFLPAWAATAMMYIVFRMGVLQAMLPMIAKGSVMEGFLLGAGPPADSFLAGAWYVLKEDFRMLNIFRPINLGTMGHYYIPPLWTIPVEFRASLLLFLVHCATFNFRRSIRMLFVATAVVICVAMDNIDIVLFLTGFLMAELNFLSPPAKQPKFGFAITAALYGLLLLGIFIGALPQWDAENTPAYRWTAWATPSTYTEIVRFWAAVGAVIIVTLSSRIASLSWFLSTPPVRYLGKISFGMYLMHWLMIRLVGLPAYWLTWTAIGKGAVGGPLGFVAAYSVLLFFLVWASDLFWRFIDTPCVNFAKDLERRCLRPEPAVLT